MKKLIIICICLFIGIFVKQKSEKIIIPNESIRMRIIANSNSIEDLYAKKKLKEEIENDIYNMVSESSNVNSARNSIVNNLEEINKMVSKKIKNFKINYGLNYFPRKEYKGVIYPEGEYESLIITLGQGQGDNWWCVLYPPLCLIEDNLTTEDVTYHSLIYDILNN